MSTTPKTLCSHDRRCRTSASRTRRSRASCSRCSSPSICSSWASRCRNTAYTRPLCTEPYLRLLYLLWLYLLWLYLLWLYLVWLYLLWQDPLFTELAGTVRTALRTTTTSTRKGGGGGGGDSGGDDGGRGDEVGERGGPVLRSVRDEDGFGTLLTLRNRPFLSELWPDMVSLPMDGEARHVPSSEPQQRQPRAACARRLEIFLDKVPLSATCPAMHHATHHATHAPCSAPCSAPRDAPCSARSN